MSNNSICPIRRTLSGATTPDQSGPKNDINKRVLHIPQTFKTGVLPSDSLMSYLGHSLEGSYPSAEMQLKYSATLADWAGMGEIKLFDCFPRAYSLNSTCHQNPNIFKMLHE